MVRAGAGGPQIPESWLDKLTERDLRDYTQRMLRSPRSEAEVVSGLELARVLAEPYLVTDIREVLSQPWRDHVHATALESLGQISNVHALDILTDVADDTESSLQERARRLVEATLPSTAKVNAAETSDGRIVYSSLLERLRAEIHDFLAERRHLEAQLLGAWRSSCGKVVLTLSSYRRVGLSFPQGGEPTARYGTWAWVEGRSALELRTAAQAQIGSQHLLRVEIDATSSSADELWLCGQLSCK